MLGIFLGSAAADWPCRIYLGSGVWELFLDIQVDTSTAPNAAL
jgi:hypothetical protein